MADEVTEKVTKVKKSKAAVEKREKGVPAGAQGGAAANAPVDETTSGVKAVLKTQGGNAAPTAGQGTTRG